MDVFFLKAGDRGFLRINETLATMGARVRTSLYRGARFPLTYPLPKRLDVGFQGYIGLFKYGLVIFADVDPEVLAPKEMRDIVSYVEQGGGLLLTGGTHSFGSSLGTYAPWESILPVGITKGELLEVTDGVTFACDHPITAAIPSQRLGRTPLMHQMETKNGDQTLLAVGDQPLLVAGERQLGRVLVLNAHPDHEAADDLFAGDFYDDLLRQAVTWLTRSEPGQVISEFSNPEPHMSVGESIAISAVVRNDAAEPRHMALTARCGDRELELAGSTLAAGVTSTVDLAGKIIDRGRYHFALTAGDQLLRDWMVEVKAPDQLQVEIIPRKRTLVPGYPLEITLSHVRHGDGARAAGRLAARARVVDSGDGEIATFPQQPLTSEPLVYPYTLPQLASGFYRVVGELIGVGGNVVDVAETSFTVVDPMDREDLFPIICDLKEQVLDSHDLGERIDEIAANGFNTLEMHIHSGRDQQESVATGLENWAEAHALERGLHLNLYASYYYGFYQPSDGPCPNAPGYREKVRDELETPVRNAQDMPRLIGAMCADEPAISAKTVCYCEHCRALYHQRYGRDMPRYEEIHDRPEGERVDFFRFLSDFGSKVFAAAWRFKQESGATFDLSHTFDIRSFGGHSTRADFRDAFAWTAYCDLLDWDFYLYMYPYYRGSTKIPFNITRYTLSGYRAVSQYHGKPLGYWVELDDRNYPHVVIPAKASGEIAYVALAQGVNYLKTFVHFPWSDSRWGARQERFDAFGAEVRKIVKYAPLLARTERPRARIAMVFPFSNWVIAPKTGPEDRPPGYELNPSGDFVGLTQDHIPYSRYMPWEDPAHNAFELLTRAFGQADLLDERLIAAGELEHYSAVALFDAEYLPRDVAEQIAAFARAGGALIADHVTAKDVDGTALNVLESLFADGGVEQLIDGTLTARRWGNLLLFSESVHEAYSRGIDTDDVLLTSLLEETVREFLSAQGMRPQAKPADGEWDAGLRLGDDCAALVLVNHRRRGTASTVELHDLPFTPAVIYDMATMVEVPFDGAAEQLTVTLEIDDMNGRVLGLYPERVSGNRLDGVPSTISRGEILSYRAVVENGAGKPAPGNHVIELEVRDPEGRVRGRYGGRKATRGGVYDKTQPFALNEVPGEWTVSLYERYSRVRSKVGFTVT